MSRVGGSTTICMVAWIVQIVYIAVTKKDIHIKVSEKRKEKLKAYAEAKEKTITQLIEDWIDRLPTTQAWLTPYLRQSAVIPTLNIAGICCAQYVPLVLKVGTSAKR